MLWRKGTELTDAKSVEGFLHQVIKKPGRLEVVVTEVEPGSKKEREYQHAGEEVQVVLSGRIEFDIDGEKYELGEGDVIWHDSSEPHVPYNPGTEKATYLSVLSRPPIE